MLLNKNSSSVALGGVSGALSIIFLLAASMLPTCKLAFVFASSVIVGMLICARGNKIAFVHYIAVSFLAMLFLPNKLIAVMYVVAVGNYPMLKKYIESIQAWVYRIAVKFFVYNLYIVICYFIARILLGIEFLNQGGYYLIFTWLLCLVGFIFYDYIYMPFVYKAYNLINKI